MTSANRRPPARLRRERRRREQQVHRQTKGAIKKRKSNLLGLASAATNLGEKQVNAKGGVLVVEVLLELSNLLLEHVGGVADTTDDTHASGVGDGSSQLGAGGDVHTSQEDGVVDLEKIGDGGADFLCETREERLADVGMTGLAGNPAEERRLGGELTRRSHDVLPCGMCQG